MSSSPPLSRRGQLARRAAAAVLFALTLSAGCSKEEVKKAFDDAAAKTQELAAPVVEKIEEQLPESGSVVLQMSPSTGLSSAEMQSAAVRWIDVGDGRPAVVQVMTYDPDSRTRRYPALMLQGTTTAASLSELQGKSVSCDLFFHSASVAPIAVTPAGETVLVNVERIDRESGTLHASLGSVSLTSSDGTTLDVQGGSLVAVIQGDE